MIFKKVTLAAMVVVLAFAALPVPSAFAADEPSTAQMPISNERLEKIWARELRVYERFGRDFDRSDAVLKRAQAMIDKAAENDKDVSALQAALDAFEAAIQKARPQYNALDGVVGSHAGLIQMAE
jgi:hypothetical protein